MYVKPWEWKPPDSDYLCHYGTPRHSGRYPWGSGDRPYQRLEKPKARVEGIPPWAMTAGAYAAFAGANLLLYAHRSGATGRAMNRAKELVTRNYKKAQDIKEKYGTFSDAQKQTYNQLVNGGVKPLKKPETSQKALRKTNPYYLTPFGKKNCFSCSMAYALRQKFGLDITAQPGSPGSTYVETALRNIVKNYKTNVISRDTFGGITFDEKYSFKKNAENALLHAFKDDGATGSCWVHWNGLNSGHAFSWEIRNGKVKFLDAQIGVEGNVEKKRYFERANFHSDFGAVRLDNADIDVEELKKYVKFK